MRFVGTAKTWILRSYRNAQPMSLALSMCLAAFFVNPGLFSSRVLCLAPDGHASIESPHYGECCASVCFSSEPCSISFEEPVAGLTASRCCVDIPLTMHEHASRPTHDQRQVSIVKSSLPAVLPCAAVPAGARVPADHQSRVPTQPPGLESIRTVVLLI